MLALAGVHITDTSLRQGGKGSQARQAGSTGSRGQILSSDAADADDDDETDVNGDSEQDIQAAPPLAAVTAQLSTATLSSKAALVSPEMDPWPRMRVSWDSQWQRPSCSSWPGAIICACNNMMPEHAAKNGRGGREQ